MTKRTLTGLYDSYEEAAQTVRDLEAAGVPASDISMVVSNADERYSDLAGADAGGEAAAGAGTGASIGGVIGGGAGLLAGLGMVAIPGIGPVVAAGWLAATAVGAVAGAGAGAAAGGLIGAMTGAGVSREHANVYAEGVRRGGTLVTARIDEAHAAEIEAILLDYGAIDAEERGKAYRQDGWDAFDERAEPYTPSEVARERNIRRSNLPL
jgi:hypothetical protein